MMALATTTVSVLRGTSLDAYQDEADNETVAASGIPCSLIEQTRRATTPSDGTPRTVRSCVGRVAGGTDIRDDDRIKDERTGRIYLIDSISQPQSPVHTPDIQLQLRRIN